MVEETENTEGKNATDYAKELSQILPEYIKVGLLHGKMKNDKKNEVMEAFAKNEIQVLETDIISFNYLRDCETPYNRIPLWELEDLRYSYMDVDGDTVKELVLLVDGGDTLILRYYKGRVYVYSFTFRNMDQLNTDGSYNWNHTGQNFEYGESQLAFDGAELKSKELWRVVNDGDSDAEYYIDGKQVSCEELLSYYEEHPKTKVEFSPLTFSLENAISPRDALKIADEYWGGVDGWHDVAAGTTFIYRVVLASQPNAVSPYYRIEFQMERYNHWEEGWESRPPYHVDVYKEVLVNIYTGKCEPYIEFEPDGK